MLEQEAQQDKIEDKLFNEYQKQSKQFYQETTDTLKKQRNAAIYVAIFSAFILITWIIFALKMAPVHDPYPVLMEVDKSTGNVNVSTILKDANKTTYKDLQQKADVVAFIRAWWTYDEVDWEFRQEFVSLHSSNKVAGLYEKHIKDMKKRFKRKGSQQVTITNVIHLNSYTIQARFYIEPPHNNRESNREYYVANIRFENVQKVDSLRNLFLNPNGFIVNEARFDREFVDKITK